MVANDGKRDRILLVNCNTSKAATGRAIRVAEEIASPSTEIIGATARFGAAKVAGYYDSFVSAAAVLEAMERERGNCDAVVMVGFGEHGREAARQLMDVPVVDITEAAMMTACLVGSRVGILSTSESSVAQTRDSIESMGLGSRLSGIAVAAVSDTMPDDERIAAMVAAAEQLLHSGADAIALAGAGMLDVQRQLHDRLGIPIVDGLTAAVTLCESLLRLGLSTSKHGPYHWPAGKSALSSIGSADSI